ncbi:hypothetical protein ACM41_05205 [Bradyrhizobium sp. CCBAU 21362]|nr:hypothetical protein [Bradyrhizobium sp. CCBAU 21362]
MIVDHISASLARLQGLHPEVFDLPGLLRAVRLRSWPRYERGALLCEECESFGLVIATKAYSSQQEVTNISNGAI